MGRTDDAEVRRHTLERLEILDALVIALDRRDELMQIVASAQDAEQAQDRLRSAFSLNQVQAVAVMDLQVRRFGTEQRDRIRKEREHLRAMVHL